MSLDVYLIETKPVDVFEANITHNLGKMASEAGIYQALWRPEEIGARQAKDIINILRDGIRRMEDNPKHFKTFDAKNHWGMYDDFLPWLRRYLAACIEHPEAMIRVSR